MSATMKEASHSPFQDPAVAPMAEAIRQGDLVRIGALAATTDLSAHGRDGATLLEWAIWCEQPRALAALLEAGADPALPGTDRDSVAVMAAQVEPPDYLQVLIEHQAPVDIVSPRGGRTPVFMAVLAHREPQLRMLMAAGADLQRIDSMGNTLLHQAALANNGRALLELLRAGVDPRAVNAQGASFQRYFFMTREQLLDARSRRERAAVEAWLAAHGIPRE
ncbi:MAG: ankyrin repeat domain-containing protein [Pseudoxanthomonas sp.]